MDQVFDMPAAQPNPDLVRMHQQLNNTNLLAVAEAMQQAIIDRQHANSVDVATVAGRINKSVKALQAVNTKQLRPVIQQLQGAIQAAQAANASALATLPQSIQMAASRPPPVTQPLPPPTPRPPLQQPPPPTQPPGGWYCVQLPGIPTGYAYWTPEEEAQAVDVPHTGPFATQEQAMLSCGGTVTHPPPIPPQPPPPPPLPPQPPPPEPPPVVSPPPLPVEPPGTTTLLQILAGDVTCSGGDYCTRMTNARALFVELGRKLSDDVGQAVDLSFWNSVVSVWTDENDFIANFKDSLRTLIKRVEASNLTTLYDNTLRYCLGEAIPDVQALYALRAACKWLESVSANVASSGTDGRTVNLNVGGNVVLVSGNLSGTSGASHQFGLTQSISVVVVPLIELIDVFIRWRLPLSPPSVGEAVQAFAEGFIDGSKLRCYVEMAGYDYESYTDIVSSQFWHPGTYETERLFRIGAISQTDRDRLQNWNRLQDKYSIDLMAQSYQQYPGIQDVVRFMVRDVWDKTVVETGQYDKEFPEKWIDDSRHYGGIAGVSDDLAKLYWRAHWVLPSTSQTYEMLHRLRPGRVDAGLVFDVDQARQLLGVNDNAPGYRDRLIAISYRPLPIRALRTLYDTAQIDTTEVGERYQDMGYSAADAELFARQESLLKLRRLASQGQGYTPGFLAKAYAASAVSDVFVRQEMLRLGYDLDTTQRLIDRAGLQRQIQFGLAGERRALAFALRSTQAAYAAGAIPRDQALLVFQSQGYSVRAGTVALDAIDVQSHTRLVLQAVTAIRRAVLQGILSLPQAASQLVATGVYEPRLSEYVATWTLQLSPKRRLLGRDQVLKLTSEGILTAEQASERLQNLGFPVDDIQLMLLEITYKRQQVELRANTALDKQRQKAAAALLRESQRTKTLADKIRVNLCKKTPLGTLRRWYVGEIVDSQYVVESLSCQGYTPEQINGYLTEFRAAHFERKQKKASLAAEARADTHDTGPGGGSTP